MPESSLNCQHLPNPEPLRLVRRMLASGPSQSFQVVVDNIEARSSIANYLDEQGYSVSDRKHGGLWYMRATPEVFQQREDSYVSRQTHSEEQQRVMIMLLSDKMGNGDDRLGDNLMQIFVRTLGEFGNNLWRIALINGAVKLASLSSPVLHYLQEYERQGVGILVCKECIFHYGLQDYSTVGVFTDVHTIISSVQIADRVLRF